jgi:hypothetical protein
MTLMAWTVIDADGSMSTLEFWFSSHWPTPRNPQKARLSWCVAALQTSCILPALRERVLFVWRLIV